MSVAAWRVVVRGRERSLIILTARIRESPSTWTRRAHRANPGRGSSHVSTSQPRVPSTSRRWCVARTGTAREVSTTRTGHPSVDDVPASPEYGRAGWRTRQRRRPHQSRRARRGCHSADWTTSSFLGSVGASTAEVPSGIAAAEGRGPPRTPPARPQRSTRVDDGRPAFIDAPDAALADCVGRVDRGCGRADADLGGAGADVVSSTPQGLGTTGVRKGVA